MNPMFLPKFTQIVGDISLAFVVRAPTRLLQLRDSAIELSQVGWFWFSAVSLCDPTLVQASPRMSGSAEYQEARSLSRVMDHEHTFIVERHGIRHGRPTNLEAFRSCKQVGSHVSALRTVQHTLD
jgi:hypothetical protein